MKRDPILSFVACLSVYLLFACKSFHPDMILFNGKIITVDENFTIAEAVAIEGDKIVAVVSDAGFMKLNRQRAILI